MSATTFRNLVHRREHQERAQPAARERFGLLEKHKDYVKRARNYHEKEKRLLALRRRASDKNPDEFNPKMHNLKTKDGVHVGESVRPKFDTEELKLMKTQDKQYLQTIKNAEDKKIAKLRASLHGIAAEGSDALVGVAAEPSKHLVFTDSVEEAAAKAEAELDAEDAAPPKTAMPKRSRKEMSKSYSELHEREERASKMARLINQIEMESALLKKGRRVKVADATDTSGAVFRWKPERKK